jgi:hypothetical protein
MFCIAMTLCCFIVNVRAQKADHDLLSDSIKADVTQFFIKEGLLDEQKVKGSHDYVYATEIKQQRSVGYDTIGIYRIGVYQSHSPEHILIKQKNEFRIFNLEEINKVLKEVITYSEKNNVGVEMMFAYIKEVMSTYQQNYNPVNVKIKK